VQRPVLTEDLGERLAVGVALRGVAGEEMIAHPVWIGRTRGDAVRPVRERVIVNVSDFLMRGERVPVVDQ
jgi:hypothetical protein